MKGFLMKKKFWFCFSIIVFSLIFLASHIATLVYYEKKMELLHVSKKTVEIQNDVLHQEIQKIIANPVILKEEKYLEDLVALKNIIHKLESVIQRERDAAHRTHYDLQVRLTEVLHNNNKTIEEILTHQKEKGNLPDDKLTQLVSLTDTKMHNELIRLKILYGHVMMKNTLLSN